MASAGDLERFWAEIPVMSAEEHPSAMDIIEREGGSGSGSVMKGKTVLVTGASSGIGVETVRVLAAAGARVFAAVRDVEKMKPILSSIATQHPHHGGLEIVEMNLESLSSVNKGAEDFVKRCGGQLNVLINNAGVMNTPYQLTKDGHEYQFGVNHLAHFLLFQRLLPLLLSSSTPTYASRVVILTSAGHRYGVVDLNDLHLGKRGYKPVVSYGQSKTANILMAREIEKRYGKQGVHALAVHPGGINTDLGRTTTWQDLLDMGAVNEKGESQFAKRLKMKNVPQGAATTVWAAVSKELEGKGGEYLVDVKIAQALPHAVDEKLAGELWEYSEKAVAGVGKTSSL